MEKTLIRLLIVCLIYTNRGIVPSPLHRVRSWWQSENLWAQNITLQGDAQDWVIIPDKK